MAEVGVSVLTKLSEYLVDPTLQQLQYLFCVGRITRNVEMRKEELILKQGSVHELVQEAINRTERIDGQVTKWKNDVRSLIAKVENLEEVLRANSGCLQGWCPTWRRYCLCKKLAKTTQRMIDLSRKSVHLNTISHPVVVPDIEYHSSTDFMFFKSTKMAYDSIWDALQDDDSSMIGLWGMGGSGKTTLVTEVGKNAKTSKLFDRVLIATISQSPNIMQIQDVMADMLGLKLEEKSVIGRAKRIALRLQSGERILIILDDIWAKLNLEDIGISFGSNHQRSCKVVLTTRRLKVCTSMKCQKIFQLDLLKEDEAWTLFQTHANVNDAIKEDVAQAIAMECKGLPIAIVAVGTCLKGKEVDEMNAMLYSLKNAKLNNVVDEEVKHAFTCLELSYNYLATSEAKLLLLMCAMFPEAHNIDFKELFIYGIGLGLCRDVDSFETARRQVRTTINHLIDSSLLMHSPKFKKDDKQEYVTMHDVVRDFALWKASEDEHTIKVNYSKELTELIADEMVKDCYAVSSWHYNNKLLQFSSQLDGPKLEFLLLRCESLDTSHASFEGTKQLKVLIIVCMTYEYKIELHPQQIQHLSNLRTLRLQHCDLRDISFVVSLTSLEILDLKDSRFERVPNGIEKLNKLKLLDLSGCTTDECCYKAIGRCLQLEELYVRTHCQHLEKGNCYEYLEGPTALMKLRMYSLEIGGGGRGFGFDNEGTRYLFLRNLNISMLGAIIKNLAQRANVINFERSDNIIQAVGGMNELKKLSFKVCSEIECIFDETIPREDVVVPMLDELVIEDMDNLKQICRGPSSFRLFQKLEILRIRCCPQLLRIFPANCNLGNLKVLRIYSCRILTSLFPISVACTLLSLEELTIQYCNELRKVLEGEGGGDACDNSRFPKLKTLAIHHCIKLEYICPVFLAQRFVKLQDLSISDVPQMKFVFGEDVGEEKPMHDQDKSELVLPLLEELRLEALPNLVAIWPERYHTRWPSIKKIHWRDCPNMELQKLKGHKLRNEECNPLAAKERIELHNCKVESTFHYQTGVGELIEKFQHLQQLTVERCARLKFMFSVHICQSLPQLTSLTVSYCYELEAMFLGNEETQKNLSVGESCMSKLKKLKINGCNKLKFILSFMNSVSTSMLPQLSTLSISDCSQMEEIFKFSNIEDHGIDNVREITFPNMKDMKLQNLPKLINVCQGFKFHIGEFRRVKVHDCPKLMPIKSATVDWTKQLLIRTYELKYDQLNNNEALNLPLSVLNAGELDNQCPQVKHNWQIVGDNDQEEQQMQRGLVPTQVLSFQYLHSLKVTGSKKLKFLFSIVHNSLPKLTSLTLSDCEELEEIIVENEKHQIKSNVQVCFPELRNLSVERCNKLKRLFSTSAATVLPQLHSLNINEAEKLEVIFRHSSGDNTNYGETILLSNLRMIELTNLPNFVSVCQGFQIQVVELSNIKVSNCPKFVDSSLGSALQQSGSILELQKLKGHQVRNEEYKSLTSRKSIELHNCGVESIFHYQNGLRKQIPAFHYLEELTLKNCARLKFVFSADLRRSLPELTSVTISCCEELEAVCLGNDEETHNNLSIAESRLPKLKRMGISKCNKLKFILSFNMIIANTSMVPQLSTLSISDCSQMEEIFKCSNIEHHDIDSEREITFPNMLDVRLDNLPKLVNVCQGFKFHTGEICYALVRDCPNFMPFMSASIYWTETFLVRRYKLKYSQLNNNEALNLLPSVLNAGELDNQCPQVEHNWQIVGDDDQEEQQMQRGLILTKILSFQYVHSLEVTGIKKLKFLFSMNTIVRISLPKLDALTISDCGELEEIIEENEEHQIKSNVQVGFPQLRTLKVERCNKLKRFLSTSTADIFPQLCCLYVEEADQLEMIFRSSCEDDANYSETFVLSSLRAIMLRNLVNFKSVCQVGSHIQVVNLSYIEISNCPKFVDSSLASALKQLGTLTVSAEDLNFQTSPNVEEELRANEQKGTKVVISRAEHLHLEDSLNLTSVWEGPTFVMFRNLTVLKVIKCRRLRCIFPTSTVVRSLPCLECLTFEDCEELEELMSAEEENNHFPNESSNSSLCFPKLNTLEVIKCKKLKWLFPSLPSTQHLPLLNKLEIRDCPQLKGLFSNEVVIHEEGFNKYTLPSLVKLNIDGCPIFSKTTLPTLQISCQNGVRRTMIHRTELDLVADFAERDCSGQEVKKRVIRSQIM